MHENGWEFIILSHSAWACMWWECIRMTEDVWEWLIFREGCGSVHAVLHYTTCMRMAVNSSDDPRMHEHACDEYAWGRLRMSEYDACWGMWAGHPRPSCIIRHARSWMGMHENDWEWLWIAHVQGWGCHSMLICMIRNAWGCMRMHYTISQCIDMYAVRMHESG